MSGLHGSIYSHPLRVKLISGENPSVQLAFDSATNVVYEMKGNRNKSQ